LANAFGVNSTELSHRLAANELKLAVNTHQRDFIREFLTYIQVEKGLARKTLESYASDLQRLNDWSAKHGRLIQDLNRSDLRKWIASLSREGLAPTSISRAVSAARAAFRKGLWSNLAPNKRQVILKRFADLTAEASPSTPQELAAMLDKEDRTVVPLIKKLGIKPE